jgi:hypothetical protein
MSRCTVTCLNTSDKCGDNVFFEVKQTYPQAYEMMCQGEKAYLLLFLTLSEAFMMIQVVNSHEFGVTPRKLRAHRVLFIRQIRAPTELLVNASKYKLRTTRKEREASGDSNLTEERAKGHKI